jgi:hypothetical protein
VNLDKETEPGQVLELDHNFSHSCDDKRNTANISFFLFQESGLRPDGRGTRNLLEEAVSSFSSLWVAVHLPLAVNHQCCSEKGSGTFQENVRRVPAKDV